MFGFKSVDIAHACILHPVCQFNPESIEVDPNAPFQFIFMLTGKSPQSASLYTSVLLRVLHGDLFDTAIINYFGPYCSSSPQKEINSVFRPPVSGLWDMGLIAYSGSHNGTEISGTNIDTFIHMKSYFHTRAVEIYPGPEDARPFCSPNYRNINMD